MILSIGCIPALYYTDVGKILTADHYSLAAVPRDRLRDVLDTAAKCKIKGKKIKFTAAEA